MSIGAVLRSQATLVVLSGSPYCRENLVEAFYGAGKEATLRLEVSTYGRVTVTDSVFRKYNLP